MKSAILIFIFGTSIMPAFSDEISLETTCFDVNYELELANLLPLIDQSEVYVSGGEIVNERNEYTLFVTSRSYKPLTSQHYQDLLVHYSSEFSNCLSSP